MPGGGVHEAEIVFLLLLLFVTVFALIARRLHTPYPIILVVAGLVLSFIPGIPKVALDPHIVFFVVLPPLLYSAAWLTPWRDFSRNLGVIFFLAFGLVAFTVFGTAETARWLFRGFDWRAGFVLGAVVAATDAIAATSIAKRVGLPRRIVDILEGESLTNDATGLLALEFGVALIVGGKGHSAGFGILWLIYVTVVGIAVGLAIAWIVHRLERRLDDAPIEIVASILVCYASYLAGVGLHASGVLAVVACGLYLSHRSGDLYSPTVRIESYAVWNSLTFALNGLVFVLIGLQLPYVLKAITGLSKDRLLIYAALFSALIILLRLVWVFPGAYVPHWVRTRILGRHEAPPSGRQVFVIGWTGMRGVLALAAAISLPEFLADGEPFPQRNLIIFLAFSVILVTLVVQGLTLPPMIRALGLSGEEGPADEELRARRYVLEAALAYLASARHDAPTDSKSMYDGLEQQYRLRLDALAANNEGGEAGDGTSADRSFHEISRNIFRAERRSLAKLRKEGEIRYDVLRKIQHELDLGEARLRPRQGE